MPTLRRYAVLLVAMTGATLGRPTRAFLLSPSSVHIPSVEPAFFRAPTELQARGPAAKNKKNYKKKSGKAKTPSGGGFGAVRNAKSPSSDVDSDFKAFPALEKSVRDTIVASPSDWTAETGGLPSEIYDRLDQIYGFPDFNYEQKDYPVQDASADGPGVSFTDLLAADDNDSTRSPSSAASTSASSQDIANLIAVAAGGAPDSPPTPVAGGMSLIESNTGKDTASSSNSSSRVGGTIDSISNLAPFSEFRILHIDPMVLAVDDFFTDEECDRYIKMVDAPAKSDLADKPLQSRSMTVGKDAQAKAQRTSTTWYNHYKTVPELMSKASRLLGLDSIDRWEEPQTVRYRRNEKFTWHLDALSPKESASELGGQRVATLLVYLTDLANEDGGATLFRDLGGDGENDRYLRVQPKKGSALLFFPSAGGIPNTPFDIRTLHCGEAVSESSHQDKWISQLWLREYPTYEPTAPVGNSHAGARAAIDEYCREE